MNEKQRNTNFGKVGWGLVIYAALTYMVTGSFWGSSATNIVAPTVSMKLGYSDTSMVLYANTIVALICVVITLLLGFIYNRMKKTQFIMGISFWISAVGLLLVGHVNSIVQYVLVWIMVYSMTLTVAQIGISIMFNKYLPTKKGTALGWATIGASMNNIVALPILNLLNNSRGFVFACYCFAAYMALLGILWIVLFPEDPAKKGFQPDNGDISPEELEIYLEAQKHPVSNWTNKELIKNKNFWLIGIGYGLIMLVTVGIASQLVVFEVQNGVPQGTAVAIMSITAVVGMVGSVVSGYVDQRFGVKTASIIMGCSFALSCMFAGYFPFTMVTNVLFIAFYSIVMGSISNLPSSHGIGCFGVDFAKAWRFINPIIGLLTALSGIILGRVQTATGSYKNAYAFLMWCAIAAVVLFAFTDSKLIKKSGEKPVAVKREKEKSLGE